MEKYGIIKKIINSKRGIILKIKDFFVCYIKHYYCILNFDINKKSVKWK